MITYTIGEIAKILSTNFSGNANFEISNISIDSRAANLNNETLFFAIAGKHNDAHNFIPQLVEKNIKSFVVNKDYADKIYLFPHCNFVIVENTFFALQQFGANHRNKFQIPIVGVTGSNGKTICKEWLYYLLSDDLFCIRSPKSYNSQVGVPLSVSLLNSEHQLAIFEAGISKMNEMERLQPIIVPTVGLFTNIGDAHQENFYDTAEKVSEKAKLFKTTSTIVYCKDYDLISQELEKYSNKNLIAWSYKQNISILIEKFKTEITISYEGNKYKFSIPYKDKASIENAINCFFVAYALNFVSDKLLTKFDNLPSIEMRLEQIEGENNCIIINDSYNSDIESIRIAIDFLNQQTQYPKKTIIVSDIEQSGIDDHSLYNTLFMLAEANNISKIVGIGSKICAYFKNNKSDNVHCFIDTKSFIESSDIQNLKNEAILIKGARRFQFEKITEILKYKTHRTRLEINLNSIINNLNYFKSLLKPETKVMAMVKGFSYGSGSHEIAKALQHNRIDYLGVAFVDEGIKLRNSGIETPILVLNPEPLSFKKMIEHNLEPEIYSFRVLQQLIETLDDIKFAKVLKIHIKFDTGMARMGFYPKDADNLIDIIKKSHKLKIASIFSHLSGSDSSEFDDFTNEQIACFEDLLFKFRNKFNDQFIAHILNSAGIERFPHKQFDMVRLGIGLYGVSATGSKNVEPISTLISSISQIKQLEKGKTVGYSRKWKLTKDSKIGILSIGYADGLDRRFSNGVGRVFINGQFAPIIGNVCMDATIVDITNISCKEGDEVIIFGKENPITELAEAIGTIPYEILTNVSNRVTRIFYAD